MPRSLPDTLSLQNFSSVTRAEMCSLLLFTSAVQEKAEFATLMVLGSSRVKIMLCVAWANVDVCSNKYSCPTQGQKTDWKLQVDKMVIHVTGR